MIFPDECLACGAGRPTLKVLNAKEVGQIKDYKFAECFSCGSLTSEMLDRATLYDDRQSPNYTVGQGRIMSCLKQVFLRLSYRKELASIGTGDCIVDYGCGSGEFSNMLVSMGAKEVWALDVQNGRPPSLDSRVKYLPIGAIDRVRARSIFARHVWEHLEDPVTTLAKLRKTASPDCRIVIEVPNAGSLFRKLMGRRWPGYFAPYHTVVFSESGLARLAARAGFEDVSFYRKESPILGFYFMELGLPRILSRILSASLFPIQKLVSSLFGSSEAIVIVLRVPSD